MIRHFYFVCAVLFIFSTAFAQQAKQIQFREESHNFGEIDENSGSVTHEFVFTNNAARAVRILNVQPSCGCTTPDWSKEPIQPGRTGFIQASFNPKGRPGHFNKSLTVTTDFEATPIVLQIKGQVSNLSKPSEADYQVVNGSLRFKTSSFNIGKVFLKDEFMVKEFPVMNAGQKAITFTGNVVGPAYIKVEAEPKVLAAGQRGNIRVSYNGKLKNLYGFQSDNVEIETDDDVNPVKSFSIFATLEDYFPQLTPEEMAKAPQLILSASSLDFGKVSSGSQVVREVEFTNNGKKDLHVKAVQGNCSCIQASAEKTVVKPGATGKVKIAFNPQDRTGTQTKAVTVYSNDPRNPVQRITFSAYVD